MTKNISLKISGMHCVGCARNIEEGLKEKPGIAKIKVSIADNKAELEIDESLTEKDIIDEIGKLNYHAEPIGDTKKKSALGAILFVVLLGIAVWVASRLGWFELLSALNETDLSYGVIFLIGLLASIHCVGMCGGLIMSYSLNSDDSARPHWQYNFGRLVSYSAIGGLMGALGSAFSINPIFSGALIVLSGALMLVFGLSLIFRLPLPKIGSGKAFRSLRNRFDKDQPLIIGLLTGFMPCGPLQAMQIYALGTGSAARGALSLAVYALGTAPLLFGFGKVVGRTGKERIAWLYKASALIIIALALMQLWRGINYFLPDQNIPSSSDSTQTNSASISGIISQTVKMEISNNRYSPSKFFVKAGIPVRWVIDVKQSSGCTDSIILHGYDTEKTLQKGENIIEFTPRDAGEIDFSCGMEMVWGKFIVSEGTANVDTASDDENTSCSLDQSCSKN